MVVAFVSALAGLAAGLVLAPLTAPFVGDVPPRRAPVALVTAAAFGLLGWRVGLEPVLPALLYLAAVGALLGVVDVKVKRLPDRFTLPSYGVAAALLAAAAPFTKNGLDHFLHALLGMAALFAVYLLQAFITPSGIGLGDVKLSGVLGLCLGWFGLDTWVFGLLATYLIGGAMGIGILVVRRDRKGEFAFGPAMLAGTLLAVLVLSS
ncbi:prepilin peptidase [Actinomadura syzygii]|uniref:Prepilin peptidase n=1 Tax=Actinomadura syzygii TaxID=1427538 RepID=A0A5D0U5I1_9ACTN|nr:A24 family peptidase [Actinomadura syzygii]TYC13668.1 prepilin peptidase [Actinomadura syzygii]